MARGATLGLLVTLLATPILAGCLGAPNTEGQPSEAPLAANGGQGPVDVVQDPEGDAMWRPTHVSAWTWSAAGQAGRRVVPCDDPAGALPSVPPAQQACEDAVDTAAALRPAPPEADILGVSLTETRERFVIELHMARVDPTFEALRSAGTALVSFRVCLDRGGAPEDCWALSPWFARLTVVFDYDGGLRYWGEISRHTQGCSLFCQAPSGVEIVPGTPGMIRWTAERAFLPGADLGDQLHNVTALLSASTSPYGEAPEVGVWAYDVWAYPLGTLREPHVG